MKISRHKTVNTIAKHYDTTALTSTRLDMGCTLWGAEAPEKNPQEAENQEINPGAKIAEKTFDCRYCDDKMLSIEDIERHELHVHGRVNEEVVNLEEVFVDVIQDQVDKTFTCRYCPDVKSSIEDLERHKLHVHGKVTEEGATVEEVLVNVVQLEPLSCAEENLIMNKRKINGGIEIPKENKKQKGQEIAEKTYNCRYCGEKKSSLEDIERHELHIHGEATDENRQCTTVQNRQYKEDESINVVTRMPLVDFINVRREYLTQYNSQTLAPTATSSQINTLSLQRNQLLGHFGNLLAREQEISMREQEIALKRLEKNV